MLVRKRFLFAMLFTMVALTAAGRAGVYKAEFEAPKPNVWSRAPVPVDNQPANMPSRWHKALRTKGALPPALFLPIQFKPPPGFGCRKIAGREPQPRRPGFRKNSGPAGSLR